MKRPKTMSEYAYLVEQALIEVDEMRHIIEYETDGRMSTEFLDPLEADLNRIKDAIATDTYDFRDEDLPFIASTSRSHIEELPFRDLLDVINWTHRAGLESAE